MTTLGLAGLSALALVFVILALTGVVSEKSGISPILFFILFGMILGPNVFALITEESELTFLKEFGLIVLLFLAGIEFDFDNIRSRVFKAVVIAVPPAIIGFGLTFGLYYLVPWFNLVETLTLGLILTTTSISLSLSALREKFAKDSEVYQTMVLAIILSNIVMILVAGLITKSIIGGTFTFYTIFVEFAVVLTFISVILFLSTNVHKYWGNRLLDAEEEDKQSLIEDDTTQEDIVKNQRMQFALGILGTILLIAYVVEIDFGIAAFFAGIYVSQTTRMGSADLLKFNALGYGLLIPIFFFTMGMQINITYFIQPSIVLQVSLILILSFIGQVILTAISSLAANFSFNDSIMLGIGLSACSLSGGFAVLSISNESGQISDTSFSIFAAIISLSVLMTIVGIEVFDKLKS